MCNPNMEAKVHELMELKRMKEELEAEIAAAEDAIKAVMGDEHFFQRISVVSRNFLKLCAKCNQFNQERINLQDLVLVQHGCYSSLSCHVRERDSSPPGFRFGRTCL